MKKFFVFFLGVMLIGCGNQQAAEKPEDISIPTTQQHDYLAEGVQYLQNADPASAIKSFDDAIKQNPLDPRAYIILGQTYMRLNDYTRAIDTFAAASRIAPDQGEIYYLLAVNHHVIGNKGLAKENAEKGLEIFRQKEDQENFMKSVALLQSLDQPPEGAVNQNTQVQNAVKPAE